jgi:hypothetical protein
MDAWVQAGSKAIGTIGLLIEKSQHVFTLSAKTAKEAWDNLKEHHEKASLLSAVHMCRRLASTKLAEEENVGNLIHAVQETVDKTIAVGEPLTDRFAMGMMLGNLPNSYGALITALECHAETDLTVAMVGEKILGEYRRRMECDDVIIVGTNKEDF